MFQFHYGSIKGDKPPIVGNLELLFQFHYGSIKGPLGT